MSKHITAANKTRDSFKYAAVPFLDEDRLVEAGDAVNTGALQPIASSVLMKVLHGARMARFDLLKAVANLAKNVTKWNANCDKRLHRLICYVKSSLDLRLKGHIGDSSDKLALVISLQRRRFRWRRRIVKTYHGNLYGPHRSKHFLLRRFFRTVCLRNRRAYRIAPQKPKLSQLTQPFASKDCPHSNCGTSY